MQYSWPYVLVVLILIVLSFLWNREQDATRKRYYSIIAVAILIFFLCLRGLISTDWQNYYPYFEECSIQDIREYFGSNFGKFEPGYTLLNIICKWIYPNYYFFVFVLGIIDLCLLLRFAKNRVENIPLFLLLFFVFSGVAIFCNLMRNFIAILIFLNALPFIEQRKPIPYFLLCLLAITFHITAILYFPIYFFFNKYPSKRLYLLIFIVCNLFFLFHISVFQWMAGLLGLDVIFQSKATTYTEIYDSSRGISLSFFEHLIIGILVLLYYDKLKEKRNNNGIYINAVIAYFVFYFILGDLKEVSTRFSYLFLYGYWIVWMDLINCIAQQNNRRLYIVGVYVYCIMRMWLGCQIPDYKYENILFGSSSYQERLYYHNRMSSNKEDIN